MTKKRLLKSGIIALSASLLLSIFSNTALAASNDKSVSDTQVEETKEIDDSNYNKTNTFDLKKEDQSESNQSSATTTFVIPSTSSPYTEGNLKESKFAPALAGVYFIPGIGEVALTATGAVVVAGIAYGAGTAIYNLVKKAISSGKAKKKSSIPSVAGNIPDRLKKSSGYVDLGKFNKKLRGGAKEEKKGWKIEPDRGKGNSHGGSAWKLYNRSGKRVATLSKDGKILRP